uniref:Peptidase_M13 domain-containing protein n=1 Tax=Schistosoma mansoni TaxID=6183 RepID=A0A5K4FB56_SCHMA
MILEETIQNNTNNSHVSNHCIDFYETACGEWEKNNPLPNDDASLTTLQRMGMNVDNYFWKIIVEIQTQHVYSCHHLIDRYFGGWELIPSLSTNINNTNKHKQSKMNNGLTNLFLPILTQTGRSPLFSIHIADDIFAVIIDWSHVLEKVLKQTGYVNYQKLPIIIEQRSELRQRCSEYRDLLNEKDGGRVTGVLVNNNRFARAYGCPVGSPMNPKMKCDVW